MKSEYQGLVPDDTTGIIILIHSPSLFRIGSWVIHRLFHSLFSVVHSLMVLITAHCIKKCFRLEVRRNNLYSWSRSSHRHGASSSPFIVFSFLTSCLKSSGLVVERWKWGSLVEMSFFVDVFCFWPESNSLHFVILPIFVFQSSWWSLCCLSIIAR